MTRTFAIMQVSQEAYEEIKQYLIEADYKHAILSDDGRQVLDMHGIGLVNMGPQSKAVGEWQALNYIVGNDENLPKPHSLVMIIVKTSSPFVEWFFAKYRGEGQFSIETQAELQDDGHRRKLFSSCHASFVTHWAYVKLPGHPEI